MLLRGNFSILWFMDTTAFWERVKTLIVAHNINQIQFASHIGMSLNTFRGWLHYKRIPDLQTAINISDALGVSLYYLINGREDDTISDDKKKRSAVKEAVSRIHVEMELLDGYF